MMLKKVKIFAVTIIIFSTAACSNSFKDSLGIRGKSPDEFKVISNAPLVVPPEFELRPPVPGEKGPQEGNIGQEAKEIIFETQQQDSNSEESRGEAELLKKTGAESANPKIKDILDKEEQALEEKEQKKNFLEKVVSRAKLSKKKEVVTIPTPETTPVTKNKKNAPLLNPVFGF